MKKLLFWLWLLAKRLYKKPTFPVLLLLIPCLCLCYNAAARQDSGIVTVALACPAPDSLTQEIFAQFSRSELVRFVQCRDPEEASLLVRSGKADEAWIFPEDLAGHLDDFVFSARNDGFIQVLRRENSVLLTLAREKLSATVFPALAQRLYLQYLRSLPGTEGVSDQALLDCYARSIQLEDLFIYRNAQTANTEGNYLLTPLRGLLAAVVALGAAAAAMYYARDVQRGTFCWVRHPWGFLPELGSQLVCTFQLSAAAGLCLWLCGLSAGAVREVGAALLYSLSTALFGMALRRLTGKTLGWLLPVLTVGLLVLCPVFFDISALRPVQLLLPGTYYINAGADPRWLGYMAIYACVCAILCRIFPKEI